MEFQVIEHTADIGIQARGKDLKEAFAAAAMGLFSIIADLEGIREDTCREVKVTAGDVEGLLVVWLNELIFLFDSEGLLFRRFEIQDLEPQGLHALVFGEKVDSSRHHIKLGVKAATYHMLSVNKDDGYTVRVLFDI